MGTFIGWAIHSCRLNGIINFIIMELICFYMTVFRPISISPILEAIWYATAFDCFVSFAITIFLKNRKR